jgi:dimethylamine monooxygenase subunit A
MTPDWLRLFPDAPHRFRMALRPADAVSFWRSSTQAGPVLAERRRWLAETPGEYSALLPEAGAIMAEALAAMAEWADEPRLSHCGDDLAHAGGLVEPDWVVLSAETSTEPRVLGGVVVFPSSWSLTEKLGRPLSEVHGPVPGLQGSLGASLNTFLEKLPRGAQWERDNWGLSPDEELNHHPTRPIPDLTKDASLGATWLRLERQFLARLPQTGGLLFGIRLSHHRLDHLAALPGVAWRLAMTLETMAPEVARYKGVAAARGALIHQLAAAAPADESGSGR